jgi:hypothetical protein
MYKIQRGGYKDPLVVGCDLVRFPGNDDGVDRSGESSESSELYIESETSLDANSRVL